MTHRLLARPQSVPRPGFPGRWLRVLSRAELTRLLGDSVEETLLARLALPQSSARLLRWEVLRRFFTLAQARARRVRGLSRAEFLRELEGTHRGLLLERTSARGELDSLRDRLALARARLEASALGEATERALADELSADLTALLAGPPTDPRAAIAELVRREGERRRAALAQALAGQLERIDLLERRVAKLRASLEALEEELAELARRAELDTGIPSIYRGVQGLSAQSSARESKLDLLRAIFEANVELQRRAA